jgi:hypothetical protein
MEKVLSLKGVTLFESSPATEELLLKIHTKGRGYPDVAISNPGRDTSKPLQLRIFRKRRVTEDVTLHEVPVLPGDACS